MHPIAFGPVPSRRLGQSLGVNNIPPKSCPYSCVYCQVGPTGRPAREPREFFSPQDIVSAVAERVRALRRRGEAIDSFTFVPDGEPTLDRHLGEVIDRLREFGIPIAVISNSALIGREDVRERLCKADWVSLKVDAADEETWRRINQPHGGLDLETVLAGILRFSSEFSGQLVTETMLVRGVNESDRSAEALAEFLARVQPKTAYLAIPTRPPGEAWVRPPAEEAVHRVFQGFARRLPRVELLTGSAGGRFGATGDAVQDLLAVTSVHPLRRDAALDLLDRDGADPSVLDGMLEDGSIRALEYQGHTYFLRRFPEEPAASGAGSRGRWPESRAGADRPWRAGSGC